MNLEMMVGHALPYKVIHLHVYYATFLTRRSTTTLLSSSLRKSQHSNKCSIIFMADTKTELNELFALAPVTELPPNVLGELQSILRLHAISPQELSYKWESYSMKMGSEQTKLVLGTARAFKKDIQEMLERESRGKAHVRSVDKRGAFATPRGAAKGDDLFGMHVQSSQGSQ